MSISDDWKIWIRSNLERGCATVELSARLREAGFGSADIDGELERELSLFNALNDPGRPAPDDRNGSMLDRLAAGTIDIPGAQRVPTNLVEIYTVSSFLEKRECERLAALIKTHLRPSTTTNPEETDRLFRTSSTCDFSLIEDPLVDTVEGRICSLLGIDRAYSEPMQGQHYRIGQEFKPHTDYFEQRDLNDHFGRQGQRTWTVMVFLNGDLLGGETRFANIERSFEPRTGLALIWNNLYPDGRPNPYSLHHGTPIELGEKTVLTKWFRQLKLGGAKPASPGSTGS